MSSTQSDLPKLPRLPWLDAMKGMAILIIALFHFLLAYNTGSIPLPFGPSSLPGYLSQCASSVWSIPVCIANALFIFIFQNGPKAAGVFIVLSGFGLTYSLAGTGTPKGGWRQWYWSRIVRLFPMYWAAHIIYLISPFQYVHDPVDYRFLLSFIGDRIIPVKLLFYLNPSWWFFGLLLELYLVFPLLLPLLRRIGPGRFLLASIGFTILSRYILNDVLQADGNWIQGAFFGARLWEFAFGMALAFVFSRNVASAEERLFSWMGLIAGAAFCGLGEYTYRPGPVYTLSDGFQSMGLFIIMAHAARMICFSPSMGRLMMKVGAYSYGIFLLHQPFIMFVGKELRGFDLSIAALIALPALTLICLGSILLERNTTKLVDFLLKQR